MEFSIHGGISPYLDIELSGGERVIAESGALLAKEPSVGMSSTMSGGFAGAFKRVLAGTSLFVVEYEGPGQVTLTHGRTGRIVPLDLDGTRTVNVASRAFLCCESSVVVDVATPKDGAGILWAQLPIFMLRFSGRGQAFAFARGDLKEIVLGSGESVDVAPGRVVYLDHTVTVRRAKSTGFLDTVLGGAGAALASLTGPGTVCLQTRDAREDARVIVEKRVEKRRSPPRVDRRPRADDGVKESWLWEDHRED